jgi:pimeloyl-ACP methyl ester carboxylesterase
VYRTLCREETHVAAALTMMSRWDVPTLLRDAVALRVPFHAIAGARDTWVPREPLERAVRLMPHATFEVIDNAGHLIPDEVPGVAVRMLTRTLDALAR